MVPGNVSGIFEETSVSKQPRSKEGIHTLSTNVLLRQCFGSKAKSLIRYMNGDLRKLFQDVPNSTAYTQFLMIAELVRRAMCEDVVLHVQLVPDTKKFAKEALKPFFLGCTDRRFLAVWLDQQNRIISVDKLFEGVFLNAEPRVVASLAKEHGASAVVFARNYMDELTVPEDDEKTVVRQFKDALEPHKVTVLDHVIVSETRVLSFRECWLL